MSAEGLSCGASVYGCHTVLHVEQPLGGLRTGWMHLQRGATQLSRASGLFVYVFATDILADEYVDMADLVT